MKSISGYWSIRFNADEKVLAHLRQVSASGQSQAVSMCEPPMRPIHGAVGPFFVSSSGFMTSRAAASFGRQTASVSSVGAASTRANTWLSAAAMRPLRRLLSSSTRWSCRSVPRSNTKALTSSRSSTMSMPS